MLLHDISHFRIYNPKKVGKNLGKYNAISIHLQVIAMPIKQSFIVLIGSAKSKKSRHKHGNASQTPQPCFFLPFHITNRINFSEDKTFIKTAKRTCVVPENLPIASPIVAKLTATLQHRSRSERATPTTDITYIAST